MDIKTQKFYLVHLIALLITLASFLMQYSMREGLPIDNTLSERIDFIAGNHIEWTLSWCIWMFAALGLFAFCAILADELRRTYLRVIGLASVAIGIAPDLIAEVIYAFVIPDTIHKGFNQETIALLETIATYLTGYLGNGLYNLGGLLLTLLAYYQGILKRWVAAWGIIAWLLGLSLSASIALGSLSAAEFFTASSMVLSTAWMIIFAYTRLRSE